MREREREGGIPENSQLTKVLGPKQPDFVLCSLIDFKGGLPKQLSKLPSELKVYPGGQEQLKLPMVLTHSVKPEQLWVIKEHSSSSTCVCVCSVCGGK